MPSGDRTGPEGRGPLTGRRLGFCAGNDRPGYTSGYGFSRGWGRGMGRRAFGRHAYPEDLIPERTYNREQNEVDNLREEVKGLKAQLSEIINRLDKAPK
ncbi:MAG: hypothetical protein GF313_04520 [Caldithrix sp.]|nr:hypothetical protein [Caldithrix sp.]